MDDPKDQDFYDPYEWDDTGWDELGLQMQHNHVDRSNNAPPPEDYVIDGRYRWEYER